MISDGSLIFEEPVVFKTTIYIIRMNFKFLSKDFYNCIFFFVIKIYFSTLLSNLIKIQREKTDLLTDFIYAL